MIPAFAPKPADRRYKKRQKDGDPMSKHRDVICIVLFFALILGVWISMSFLYQTETVELSAVNGRYDLSGCDFEHTVYHAQRDWENWPDALNTPEDFANGAVTNPPQFLSEREYKNIPCATHRLRLTLPPGQTCLRHIHADIGIRHAAVY